jgi:ribosomal subunit interface protein
MTLSWNIVAKNLRPHEQLQEKLREKISKLERHLQHFPPDAVHLQVALDRNTKKGVFTAALTLKVPSNVLRSAKSASDPIPAVDHAVKALFRELATLKSDLRHEAAWNRENRPDGLPKMKVSRFTNTPLAPGTGPQTLGDIVRPMTEEHYGQLLFYVRRELDRAQMERSIPADAIDAEAVADEVARQAISGAERKPDDRSYRLWLYALARRELERRFRDIRDSAVSNVSLEAAPELPNTASRAEGNAVDERVSILGERLDWAEIEDSDFVADAHVVPPDAAAAESDLIDHLQKATQDWPREERSVFELHFLEGFEPDEVAMLEDIKTPQAQILIQQVQTRLRAVITEAMQAKASSRSKVPLSRRSNRPERR